MPADVLPYIESTWLINMTNLTYSSQCNSWRPGRIDTKTRDCLRELHSLTVSKSVRFLYSEFRRCSWDVKLSIGWSENIQLPDGENLGKLYPPGFLSKYFRPHLVNWADFAPSMTSAQITPAPAVAAYRLTPELSSFSHIWDKLASISLNGKCCRSSTISRLEVKLTIT